jgi:hypothetical protein
VAGEAAGDDDHRVDTDIVVRAGEAVGKRFGGGGDSAEAVIVDGVGRFMGGGASFYLHEDEGSAAAGDEIDFADGGADALGEDRIAFEAQKPGGQRFGAAAATLRPLPVHFSASARS